MCECSSIIPAVKCLFVPSISNELLLFSKFFPIDAIRPLLIATSVFLRMPSFSFVQTVVFRMIKFCCFGTSLFPYALFGNVTGTKSIL